MNKKNDFNMIKFTRLSLLFNNCTFCFLSGKNSYRTHLASLLTQLQLQKIQLFFLLRSLELSLTGKPKK
jgi:hypothetical protein